MGGNDPRRGLYVLRTRLTGILPAACLFGSQVVRLWRANKPQLGFDRDVRLLKVPDTFISIIDVAKQSLVRCSTVCASDVVG